MRYMLNGQLGIGPANFWRVDDLESGRVAMDMLQHPAALISTEIPKYLVDQMLKALNERPAEQEHR